MIYLHTKFRKYDSNGYRHQIKIINKKKKNSSCLSTVIYITKKLRFLQFLSAYIISGPKNKLR